MIACSKIRAPIRLAQQGLHLGLLKIPDHGFGRLFERYCSYFGAPRQVDGRAHANEASQQMDGCKLLVAANTAALAITLQVIKELADNRRRQVFHGHVINSATTLFAGEWQQSSQSVAAARALSR
jgi:hypothetical protein